MEHHPRRWLRSGLVLLLILAGGCSAARAEAPTWIAAARAQVGVTLHYDPAYRRLDYPGGDVPLERGVCTDVVIRAFRHAGLDLQQAVHEDMRRAFTAYPPLWGLTRPDRHIDHRRVPNLATWMTRQGWATPSGEIQPGDVLTWILPGNLPHVGIVSDRRDATDTRWLILHNVGAGTREEDVLERWPRTGWFRPRLPAPTPTAASAGAAL